MPTSDNSDSEVVESDPEIVEDVDELPSAEKLQEILRHLWPRPEILPLLRDAFGENHLIYLGMDDVLNGQPADNQADLMRLQDWLRVDGWIFYDVPPIREVIPDPEPGSTAEPPERD